MYTLETLFNLEDKGYLKVFSAFESMKPGTMENISIPSQQAACTFDFQDSDRLLLNGYQSWTDTREHTIHDRMRGTDSIPSFIKDHYHFTQYGDYTFVKYGQKPGQLHGFSYGYIKRGELYYFFGSLNEDHAFTLIRTDCNRSRIYFERDVEGIDSRSLTKHDAAGLGLHLFFALGTEAFVFDSYFQALGIASCSDRGIQPLFGYTSWYRHYQEISAVKLQNDLNGLSQLPIRCNVFQIDDGYQHGVGDWLEINTQKFPEGIKPIVEQIQSVGLTPGIWLAPFVCEENSHLFKEHPDWLVKDSAGKPIMGGSNWSGFYALDLYHPEVRSYLKQVFSMVIDEWGFRLLKLDFLYAVCIYPHAGKTRGQIMHDAMVFLRECTQDKAQILGCGVPLASAFGLIEYCRIGCDVSLSYDDVWYMQFMHRERPSTKNTIQNSVFRRQLDGRAFLNDPDVFLLRDDHLKLTPSQKVMLSEINALTGNVIFTSDDAGSYSDQARENFLTMMKLRDWRVTAANLEGPSLRLELQHKNDPAKTQTKIYQIRK